MNPSAQFDAQQRAARQAAVQKLQRARDEVDVLEFEFWHVERAYKLARQRLASAKTAERVAERELLQFCLGSTDGVHIWTRQGSSVFNCRLCSAYREAQVVQYADRLRAIRQFGFARTQYNRVYDPYGPSTSTYNPFAGGF
jgi:hypothetical protein